MDQPLFPASEVTGIVLAGGKSSRFGTNKALHPYKGKRLVEYAIGTLAPLCGRVLLSAGNGEDFAFTCLETVKDVYADCGPLGGIHACLNASATAHNLVVGCDLPRLDTRLLAFLLQQSPGWQVVIPAHQGFRETMVGYYHRNCLSDLELALLRGEYRILDAIRPLNVLFPEVSGQDFYAEKLFANINHPRDLPAGENGDENR